MRYSFLLVIAILAFAAAPARAFQSTAADSTSVVTPQTDNGHYVDTVLTIPQYILAHLDRFHPRGYKEQLQTCNDFQRSGYANIAFEIDGGDGLLAFIQLMKNNLEIAFGMFHIEFTIQISETVIIVLPDNWDFPDDPWKREWWSEE